MFREDTSRLPVKLTRKNYKAVLPKEKLQEKEQRESRHHERQHTDEIPVGSTKIGEHLINIIKRLGFINVGEHSTITEAGEQKDTP